MDQLALLSLPAKSKHKRFLRKDPFRESENENNEGIVYDVIVFGLGRFGSRIIEVLDQYPGIKKLGIDFDPQVVKQWQEMGKSIIYGDMEDPELLEHIPYQSSKCIISTITDRELSIQIITQLRRNGYKGKI